jgi:hypothetical protein
MITNDGAKTAQQGALDKARGLLAGMPDIMICKAASGYHGLYVEFKTDNGRLSDAQVARALELTMEGYKVATIRHIDGFIELIINYLNNQINTGTGETNGNNNGI